MRAIWAGFAAAIVIAIGAYAVLEQQPYSSAERYSSPNVRLAD